MLVSYWRSVSIFASKRCPKPYFSYFCFTTDNENPNSNNEWNISTLLKEISRQHYRTSKKLNAISAKRNADDALEGKKILLVKKANDLIALEAQLQQVKSLSTSDTHYVAIMEQVNALQLKNYKGKSRPKAPIASSKLKPKQSPRQIYFSYLSDDNIPIRVGKQATDNDILSCNYEYRDDDEWWLHASGCPGSHVVIKSTDDDLNKKFPQTVSDAALLAAHRSKNKLKEWCDVKLTRCKYVKKVPGTPPGQVLVLDVATLSGKNVIRVNMKKTRVRFEQLEKERIERQQK